MSSEPNGSEQQTEVRGALDVTWTKSYDRQAVEQFAAAIEAERLRLESEIAAARARIDAARVSTPGQAPEAAGDLGRLMLSAHREIAGIEEEHRIVIDAIRRGAESEAARLRAAASAEAAAIRASLARLAGSLGSTDNQTTTASGPEHLDPDTADAG